MTNPREYLKIKYMGDCKCGDCQLVPPAELASWADALESIAAWRKVSISGECESGLRSIIRAITDCAANALDIAPHARSHKESADPEGA